MLDVDVHEGVATVTLQRPEALNAINDAMCDALHAAWDRISADTAIRAAVLCGAGDRAFCAGADLREAAPRRDKTSLARLSTPKPVIAAIHGFALGAGLELALLCDIRIASTTARMGFPEVGLGIVPAAGGTQRLARAMSPSDALFMLLGCETVDAAEALRMGLVSRVVAPQHLATTARAIAGRVAANAPLAVQEALGLVRGAGSWPLDEGFARERESLSRLRGTRDSEEGMAAHREARPPRFTGS